MIKLAVCLSVHVFQDTLNIAKVSNFASSGTDERDLVNRVGRFSETTQT